MQKSLALLFLLFLPACTSRPIHIVPEGAYNAYVIVQDDARRRLSGVKVKIGPGTCWTDALGSCHLIFYPGDYPLRAEGAGYSPYISSLTINTDVMIRIPLLELPE